MTYKIFALGDVHWGVMDPDKQRAELEFIPDYLSKNKVDLVVICGDYFDHRLSLNSRACVYALEFLDRLIALAEYMDFQIRMFPGTKSHDYDQLDALNTLESEHFIIHRKTSYEPVFPDLHCIFCPDETMNATDYLDTYKAIIFEDYTGKKYPIDIMFFHGTFDVILGDLLHQQEENTLIFEYGFYNQKCAVMLGGHWHDADEYGNLIYCRSPNRFKFDEDNTKGAVVLTYDTDTQAHSYERVINPSTDDYITYTVDTSLYQSMDNYSNLCTEIDEELKANPSSHIRVLVYLTDEKEINKSCIDSLTYHYSNNRNVKVTIENKMRKQEQERKRKENAEVHTKFSYLFDNTIPIHIKYQRYIKDTEGIDVDAEQLKDILTKYEGGS